MESEKLKIEPVKCLGKGCGWYEKGRGNIEKRGVCGCSAYLKRCGENPSGPEEVEVGETICQYRDPGMYNYYEPELI